MKLRLLHVLCAITSCFYSAAKWLHLFAARADEWAIRAATRENLRTCNSRRADHDRFN